MSINAAGRWFGVTGFWFAMLIVIDANAQPFVPAGLNPGDPYYLIFVTSEVGPDPTVANFPGGITDYDSYIEGVADAGSRTSGVDGWKVIGSTPAIDAITHLNVAASTAPVFNTIGEMLVAQASDLFNPPLLVAPRSTENGVFIGPVQVPTWTGTNNSGVASRPLNDDPTKVLTGRADVVNFPWSQGVAANPEFVDNRYFGFSPLLTAPSGPVVPEPGTFALVLVASPAMLFLRSIRRRRLR